MTVNSLLNSGEQMNCGDYLAFTVNLTACMHRAPTYCASVDKGVLKSFITGQEVVAQCSGVCHIAEERNVDLVRGRDVL